MGFQRPDTLNHMRETKAEGGWGVVCTEYCSIHPSSDDSPGAYCTLWDEDDVRNLAGMTEAVHRHGALRRRRALVWWLFVSQPAYARGGHWV